MPLFAGIRMRLVPQLGSNPDVGTAALTRATLTETPSALGAEGAVKPGGGSGFTCPVAPPERQDDRLCSFDIGTCPAHSPPGALTNA